MCGKTVTAAPAAREPAQDRALRAVVDDGDAHATRRLVRRRTARAWRPARRAPAPSIDGCARTCSSASSTGERALVGDGDRAHRARRRAGGATSARVSISSRPTRPCSASQRAQSSPPSRRMSTAFACGVARLAPLVGDAVVADHRRREADELLRVARVGDRLLVAGHPGREHRLAEGDAVARRRSGRGRRCRPRAARYPAPLTPRTPPVRRRPSSRPRRAASRRGATSSPSASGSRPRVTVHSASRSSEHEVRARADLDPRLRQAERARRAGGHALEQRLERERARAHEVRVERRERRLEAGHAERRLLERHVLLVPRVRRVIGRDAGDRAVAERVDERLRGRPRRASGGFIFMFGSSERTSSSVRQRWCGVTSPVARDARARARARARRPTRAPRGA